MKRVAIISPFFYPELIGSAPYNYDLAVKLRKENMIVEVYCSHPMYPEWKPKKGDLNVNDIKLFRGGLWLKYPNKNILRRLILETWFFFFILINIFRINRNDLVFVIFPPSLMALTLFFLRKNTKIIGIVHDLQAVHLGEGSFLKECLRKMIKFFEKAAFNACNNLIFLSAEMQNEVCNEYKITEDRCAVVYPSITIQNFHNKNNLSKTFNEDFFNIVYSGALGQKQDPYQIFKTAKLLVEKNTKLRFYFFSNGQEFDRLREMNSSENIIFKDLVKKEDLPELLVRSDLQLISQIQGSSKGSLPSKLPNILASGTPVLSITDRGSELQEILENQEGCFILNEWDTKKITKLVNMLSAKENNRYNRKDKLEIFMPDYIIKIIKKMIS